jgi:hypothetical protein
VRRWLALAGINLRAVGELNRIVAHLAKFGRADTLRIRRRIRTQPGPAGDRQAIVAHAKKPVMLTPEETLAFPAALALAALLALFCQAIRRIFEPRSLGCGFGPPDDA